MPKQQRNQRRARGQKPVEQIKIAKERIQLLIRQSIDVHTSRPDLSRRYFQLAKKIGMRYNIRISREQKRKFCKKCFSYIGEGWRFKKGRAQAVCRHCGDVMRYPYKPKRQK